ncbi:hypothetical protein WB049_00125 [Staphylococcus aureus]
MSKEAIQKILEKYQDVLQMSEIVPNMLRSIGWYFLHFLVWITDLVSNLTIQVLTLFGLLTQDSISKLILEAKPVLISVLALAIIYIGIKLMLGRPINKADIFATLVVAVLFLGSVNIGLQKGSELTKEASKAIENFDPDSKKQTDGTKVGSSMLAKSIVDVQLMAEKGFPDVKTTRNNQKYNNLNASAIKHININQELEEKEIKKKDSKEVLKKKLVVDEAGRQKVEDLEKNWFGLGDEKYYRFHVKWFTAAVGLICLALGHFLAALRVASIALEIIVNKILAIFFSHALQGERLKSTIIDILNGFVSIIMIFFCLFLYKEVVSFLNDKPTGIWLVGLIAATWFMIDGPKSIERKFGYDAGLRSPFYTMAGMYGMGKAATALATNTASGTSSMIKAVRDDFSKSKRNDVNNNSNEQQSKSEQLNKASNNQNTDKQQNVKDNQNIDSNSQVNDRQNNTESNSSHNGQSNSKRQSLDEEMKNSNYGNNTFKGVGESHSQLWANRAPDGGRKKETLNDVIKRTQGEKSNTPKTNQFNTNTPKANPMNAPKAQRKITDNGFSKQQNTSQNNPSPKSYKDVQNVKPVQTNKPVNKSIPKSHVNKPINKNRSKNIKPKR